MLEDSQIPVDTLKKATAQQQGKLLTGISQTAFHKSFGTVEGRVEHDIVADAITCKEVVSDLAEAAIVKVRADHAVAREL